MKTRKEIDRIIVKRTDAETYNALRSQGYCVLRKSRTTKVMVLWGEEFTEDEIAEANAQCAIATARISEIAQAERQRLASFKEEARQKRLKEVSISNLWMNFNRKPNSYLNIKRNSFYFTTESGEKVRVSDHECWYFQSESEKSASSRAADFEAPDFDFVIENLEGMTRDEVVKHIKETISKK